MKKTRSSALPKKPYVAVAMTETDLSRPLPLLSPKSNSKMRTLTINPEHQRDSKLLAPSQILSARGHDSENPIDPFRSQLLGSPQALSRPGKSIKLSLPPRSRVVLPALPLYPKNKTEPEDETPMFRNRLKTPLQQERVISGDENPHEKTPKSGMNEFYSHYKNLDKIRDINEFNHTKDALYTNFLRKSENLNLLPSKIGFIASNKASDKGIQLNHYRLGDKKAAVLSEGLKTMNDFHKLELAHNRLTSSGAELILSTVTNSAEVINLSGNSIGRAGCEHLSKILKFKYPKLQELNLEGNKLGDLAITNLLDALIDNDTLTKLNLNKNQLTNTGANSIAKMVEQNSSIEELYLSWNQIKSQGGSALFDAMAKKPHVRVLDLSWNSLGLYDSPFAANFAAFIIRDRYLVHLDLSNNSFSKKSALIISEALKSNHSLYGFHFHGNFGYVDAKGFLIVADDYAQDLTVQMLSPQLKGTKIQLESIKRHHNHQSQDYQDVCWICEGWRPVEIQWNPESSGTGSQDPIYVHLSYEGYQGRYISQNKEFKTVRMAPPTKFNYLFSIDDLQTHAEDHHLEEVDSSNSTVNIIKDGKKKELKMEFLNKFDAVKPFSILDEDYRPVEELVDLEIKPRIADEIYIPPEILTAKPEWKFSVSIFKDYKIDSQALLDRCFEVDFEGTRIAKIVKNEDDLKSVREILHKVYKNLKECYKYYAAIGAPSEIWSIPMNTYTEFCSSAGVIDGKILKLSDFDRIFIATYTRTEKDKNPRNPDRALVRYQFMEGLVRIADQKYLGSGLTNNYKDAIKLLLNDNLGTFLNKFDHQKWRTEKYWNEAVDTVLKSYLPILKGAYKKNIGLRTLPGQRKFMCLEEFHRLMGDLGVFTDNFGDRDATLAFSLSMMTQTDELQSDRVYQMQFVEFLEAFARIADKYSAAPYGVNDTDMPYEERFKQPLHIKIEGLMQRLFEASGSETKEVWILPETSVFEMEEVHGKQRFATKKKKILRIDPTESSSSDPYDC